MSLYGGIVNPNTNIRASQTSSKVDSTNCSVIFLSIPNWPAFSTVQRIIVTRNNDTMAAVTATLYNGPANDGVFDNLVGTDTLTFNTQGVQSIAVNYPIINPTKCDFIEVSLHAANGSFAKDATYTVELIGIRNMSNSASDVDTVPWKKDAFARFITWNHANLLVTDITHKMFNSWLSSEDTSDSTTVCETIYDCFYIGTSTPLPSLYFSIDATTKQVSASGSTGVAIDYLDTAGNWTSLIGNGTTASSYIAETSTSSSQKHSTGTYVPYNSLLEYSGIIKFVTASTLSVPAAKTQLVTTFGSPSHDVVDPYYTMGQEINAGTNYPIGMYNNPNRYWIRISFPTGTVPFKLHGVQIVDY